MSAVVDETRKAAEAIQHNRLAKIMRLLDIVKDELGWPHPAALEGMDDELWRQLDVAALTLSALRETDLVKRNALIRRARAAKVPSDVTREQALRIYRADYARKLMTQPDPFEGLDDMIG
jgi:hypothetical protein